MCQPAALGRPSEQLQNLPLWRLHGPPLLTLTSALLLLLLLLLPVLVPALACDPWTQLGQLLCRLLRLWSVAQSLQFPGCSGRGSPRSVCAFCADLGRMYCMLHSIAVIQVSNGMLLW